MTAHVPARTPAGRLPLPPSIGTKRRFRRSLNVVLTSAFAVLAVAYLVLPAWWQWTSDASTNPVHAADQLQTAAPAPNPQLASQLRGLPTSGQGAPVILTYHDINTHADFYTVSPATFAAQMQLLHDAGYHTLTAAQLNDWLRGVPLPPHSVLLTFDDGPSGVWTYADPILARYGFHAMAFIITGFVGTRPPYYMNWPEISKLAASGRWDIESHTDLGHVHINTDARGNEGPFLTSLHYLAAEKRTETLAEYTRRITDDLANSKAKLVQHGLPAPDFFAYPYSANTGAPQTTEALHHAVASDFRAAMLDESGGATITTPADVAAGNLRRLDVTADVDLPSWVDHLRAATALDPAEANPTAHPGDWVTAAGAPAHLMVDNGTVTLDAGPAQWMGVIYDRSQTSLWRHYTLAAALGGSKHPGDGTTTGLRVLTDDPQQVQLTVSAGSYQVRQGVGETQHLLAEGELPVAPAYAATLAVTPTAVTVTIGQRIVAVIALHPVGNQPPAGGIELTGQREKPTSPVPTISHLTTS